MYLFSDFIFYFYNCKCLILRKSVLHTVEAHSNFMAYFRHLVLKTYIMIIIMSIIIIMIIRP